MTAMLVRTDDEIRSQILAEHEARRLERRRENRRQYEAGRREYRRMYYKDWYERNKEHKREYNREWNKTYVRARKEREQAPIRDVLWVSSDSPPDKRLKTWESAREKAARPKKIRGVAYDELLQKQDGKCAVCGVEHTSVDSRLCVDHDHETGRIRGLLCFHCNVMLGHAKDDLCTLHNAIEYLRAG